MWAVIGQSGNYSHITDAIGPFKTKEEAEYYRYATLKANSSGYYSQVYELKDTVNKETNHEGGFLKWC